ncbi:MAG: hypothetical protein ACYTAO_20370 [Planctomycetota bacterium]|jgi:hypothetical protein
MATVSTEQCEKNRTSLKALMWRIAGALGVLGLTALGYSVGANGAAKETRSKVEAQDKQLQEIQTNIREIRQMQMKILKNHAGGE